MARTINGEVLIDDYGNFNEQAWLENAIAVYALLSGKKRKVMMMNKLDIYDGLVSVLTDTIEWRTGHPELANAFVDGAVEMCLILIDKISKGGDSDET